MIIVLLLFFQSICLYCQRIVLYIHDRWINPENVRILKEAAEATGTRYNPTPANIDKRTKKRSNGYAALEGENIADTCRFCVNSPQGYCRHHFHLQELQVQKQQKRQQQRNPQKQHQQQQEHQSIWQPIIGCYNRNDGINEYRQLRKIKRELKRNLKNRFNTAEQQQQQQQQFYYQATYNKYARFSHNADAEIHCDNGYFSNETTPTTTPTTTTIPTPTPTPTTTAETLTSAYAGSESQATATTTTLSLTADANIDETQTKTTTVKTNSESTYYFPTDSITT